MTTSPFPPPTGHTDPATGHADPATSPRLPVGRRRLLALAAGTSLLAGGVVAVTGSSASAIVDGEPTTASANPWQVALTSDGEQFCGGSLVSDRVVVTAAHCTEGTPAADIQIRAGAEDLTSAGGQTVRVASVIEHPSYAGGSADIAMLVLERPVEFNGAVAAIPVATASEAAAATTGRVTGWGALGENDDRTPAVLQTADVPTVGDAACDRAVDGIDAANELCAGGTGTDSCYGDSGGPLTIDTDRGRVLAGVTSWGLECGGDTPGVYAEVPTFAGWIAERVADPDAPTPERADPSEFAEDIGFDDELPDGVEVDEDGYVEIPDAFFDEYGDDALEQLSDDDFWNLFIEWSERQNGGVDTDTDTDSTVDVSDENDGTGTEFDHETIDQLDDEAFGDWIDSLSDDEFDRYLDEIDRLWGDSADDLGEFPMDDLGEFPMDDDIEFPADDVETFPIDDGIEFPDDEFESFPMDDDGSFDDGFGDLSDFDTNGDGTVQWDELDELLTTD